MKTSLKILIFITLGLSLAAGFIPQLYNWLALSWAGIEKFYLWQLITYILLEKGPLSFGFFVTLAFNMYILWMFGSSLIERSHTRLFFFLYLGAALLGGCSALIIPHSILASSTNAVYAILVSWMMLNPGSQLLLFFTLPFKAHWLILGLIAMTFLFDLSNANWAEAISLAVACLYSYLFALVIWREPGPFPFLRRFEKRIFQFLERQKKHETYRHSKIYDIKSGAPVLDDDPFMDAMLDRISRHGEESLTPEEKKRMQEISKKKK